MYAEITYTHIHANTPHMSRTYTHIQPNTKHKTHAPGTLPARLAATMPTAAFATLARVTPAAAAVTIAAVL